MSWEKTLQINYKKHGITFKIFEQKFYIYFQKQLKIYMPKDLLKNECKNSKLLIEYFGRT
jgi:hypothetical protein